MRNEHGHRELDVRGGRVRPVTKLSQFVFRCDASLENRRMVFGEARQRARSIPKTKGWFNMWSDSTSQPASAALVDQTIDVLWRRYREDRSTENRNRLVIYYAPLVASVAGGFAAAWLRSNRATICVRADSSVSSTRSKGSIRPKDSSSRRMPPSESAERFSTRCAKKTCCRRDQERRFAHIAKCEIFSKPSFTVRRRCARSQSVLTYRLWKPSSFAISPRWEDRRRP